MMRKHKPVKVAYVDIFDNETPPAIVDQSANLTEAEIDEEVVAIDKMLAGDDGDFDKLEY